MVWKTSQNASAYVMWYIYIWQIQQKFTIECSKDLFKMMKYTKTDRKM